MEILGLSFAGTATDRSEAMAAFVRDRLGLRPLAIDDLGAEAFALPDGAVFAVADADPGEGRRTIGCRVADLDAALTELRAAGVGAVDGEGDGEVQENRRFRYAHFRAPDGRLYELIEERGGG